MWSVAPPMTDQLAKVWRKSCSRTSSSPARAYPLPNALDPDEVAGADASRAVRRGIGAPGTRENEMAGESGQTGKEIERQGPEANHLGPGLRIRQPQTAALEVDE